MPYLGNISANRFASTPATKRFNGDGSTTSFTLDTAASADQEILVSVDGVIQDSANYTVTGTTLDFGSGNAPSSGTNNIFVNYIARPIATVGHPSTSNLQAAAGTFTSTLDVTGATTFSSTVSGTGYDLLASALDSSTATSLEISLPTGYVSYYLTISLIGSSSSSGHFDFVYKLDGQSSFHTSDYTTQGQLLDNGTQLNENASASNIQLMANNSALNGDYAFNIWLNGYGTTDIASNLSYIVTKATNGGSATWVGGGANTVTNTNNSKMIEIKITPSTGSISKSHYRLYGIA